MRPRVVVCEYNPSIPAEIDLYADYGNYFGSSVSALVRIAETRNYKLIAITDTNCIFVRSEFHEKFSEYETSLKNIKIDKYLVHLITSYSGEYVFSKDGPFGITNPYRYRLIGEHYKAGCRWRSVDAVLKLIKKITQPIYRLVERKNR